MQTSAGNGFERWQEGLKKGPDDPRWSIYDCEIKAASNGFNRHLAKTPNYRTLDWRLIKSMLWVETGAASAEWKTKPMQIGVPGDPGLKALLSNEEGGELILDAVWKSRLTASTVSTLPLHNIHAGIAYLLMRLAILIAQRYNGGGDPLYARKLDYAFSLVKNAKEGTC